MTVRGLAGIAAGRTLALAVTAPFSGVDAPAQWDDGVLAVVAGWPPGGSRGSAAA